MSLLDVLEWLVSLPAELWLVPPVLILGLIAAIGVARHQAFLSRWQYIAEQTGLRLDGRFLHPPKVEGTFRGRRLSMMTCGRPTGRQSALRKSWTRVSIEVQNPEFVSLKMLRQDVFDTLLASIGFPDLRTGDEAFDRRFVIQTRETELTKQLLSDAALRNRLLKAHVDTVELSGGSLAVYYAREERDGAHAELLFAAAVHLADAVDRLKGNDAPEILVQAVRGGSEDPPLLATSLQADLPSGGPR